MNKAEVIHALSALAHPSRMDVFRMLVVAGREGMTPGALMKALDVDKAATMSTYLRELAIPGLITQERLGRNLIYRAAYDRMDGVLGFLTENCCKGVPEAVTADADSCGC
jgi:predicted transcriptional regulator